MLTPVLEANPYIVRDTREFVRRVSPKALPPTGRVVAVDLKDFYMSGEHHEIAQAIGFSDCFQGDLRSLMSEAIYFMLENQYVITSKCPCFYTPEETSEL